MKSPPAPSAWTLGVITKKSKYEHFKKAFWKEKQLSGFVFSNQGPLSEIHDASTKDKAALFGFLGAQASRNELEKNIKIQKLEIFIV